MITPQQLLNNLNEHLGNILPDAAKQAQEDVHNNVKVLVAGMLSRLDLVTREEYEVQMAVLRKTREKVDMLERQVAELEKRVSATQP
ncbi:hypothetical protein OLMES_0903 [Oleiphilus messinensis]|uniref:Ubiquinone biosynthesis accessory factor UbiK n=1 Tax=Oleiphilus messinensis TaxID=141451 RepID=A0A1Y0I426_9GAMM|nr:accessory factor UbiK family protein [Oleiphilus messinensis]ARU54990.1 hypothetical protein OLMES_0903 [Oleiphilus messinensis]